MKVMKLDLRAPLPYRRELGPPLTDDDERVCLYELDDRTGQDLDPQAEGYLGEPILTAGIHGAGEEVAVPQGTYLFAQLKAAPEPHIQTALAIEVQKEGLWQGLAMGKRLYVRILREEDGTVTQALRPLLA